MNHVNRKNVVISSTRQWNPGDEFIRIAVENLFDQASGWDTNWILYDRNPDIRNCRLPNISNSFFNSNVPYVDMILLAGTSEWCGASLTDLYRYSLRFSVPVMAIGIGTPGFTVTLSHLEEYVLRYQTRLILARDRHAANMLSTYGIDAPVMPCPSLLCSPTRQYPIDIKSVAIVWQFADTRQPCELGKREALVALCRELQNSGYETSVIVHYIEELEALHSLDLGCETYYHYEPRAYLELMKRFDAIIGLRLHGCLAALSSGRPAILIPHDERTASTAREVPSLSVCPLDQVHDRLLRLRAELPTWSRHNETFLESLKRKYLARIRKACSNI